METFHSALPTVIYSADSDDILTEEQKALIRSTLGINVVHNQEAPEVQTTTRPATTGPGDVQRRRAVGPAWTHVPDQDQPFDLILQLTNDLDRWRNEANAYAAGRGSKVVRVTSAAQFADAIDARRDELTTDPAQPAKIRVLVVGHGNGAAGPLFGGGLGEESTELFDAPVASLAEFEDGQVLAGYMQGVFQQSQLARIRGKVSELMFSNCSIADSVGARKLIDAIRTDLQITKLTAGKMLLFTSWREVAGKWVTEIGALAKRETPLGDVLYVSGGQ